MDKLNTLARPNILMHRLLQDALVIAKAAALVDVSTTRVWSFLNYYGPGTNFNNYVSIEIQRVNFLFRFQAHAKHDNRYKIQHDSCGTCNLLLQYDGMGCCVTNSPHILIYFDIHVLWRILQCGSISQFNKICTSHLFQTVGVRFRLPC